MKIAGRTFRNVSFTNKETCFYAIYKGKKISITTNHGYGKPKFKQLNRFLIDVTDIKTGMIDVDSYEDCETIDEAIQKACTGAMI